jgi:hypothetical protein
LSEYGKAVILLSRGEMDNIVDISDLVFECPCGGYTFHLRKSGIITCEFCGSDLDMLWIWGPSNDEERS